MLMSTGLKSSLSISKGGYYASLFPTKPEVAHYTLLTKGPGEKQRVACVDKAVVDGGDYQEFLEQVLFDQIDNKIESICSEIDDLEQAQDELGELQNLSCVVED
jgi:hypothetical protein